MHFENEQHYNEAMNANAQAEAEYMQEMQYQQFLNDLIANREYKLFAIYAALDLLHESEFKNSGLSPQEYLVQKKNELENIKNTGLPLQPCDPDTLPF